MQESRNEYAEMVAAFGEAYLSGRVSRTMQGSKFCMLDNLEEGPESRDGMDPQRQQNRERMQNSIRYPHRITMSFCIFCKSGSIRARIQQKGYSLGSGDVLLLFTGQILEYAEPSPDCRVIFIAIDSEFILTQIRNRYGDILRDWVLRKKEPTLMHLEEESAANFEKLCASIKYIIKDAGSDYADGIVYGFTTIFANLLTSWHKRDHSRAAGEEGSGPQATNAQKVLLRFQNDIRHFALRYKRVSYYAKRQNLSLRQFSRLIAEASGEKPSALIDEYLVLEAKSLLQTGNFSVHQVCGRLGFDNDSFFNRWFKRLSGTTPGRYLNKGREA